MENRSVYNYNFVHFYITHILVSEKFEKEVLPNFHQLGGSLKKDHFYLTNIDFRPEMIKK